ncbi:flagellar basal body-associated FliL family protein [Zhaonella formicivorans]|uniref:flagellar basal body-associated FliL family protein n=1 Tax=Zhaonella formicivorans TaxID=2528593 RepID=UPI0010D2006A|nr:flagellar basal body-associated FliL family protein [Zhaonella formicivorans]
MSDQQQARKNPLIIIIILLLVLVLLILAGGAAYYFLVLSKNAGDKTRQEEPFMKMTFEPFTVNLSDSNFRRYVRLTITVEYTDKKLGKEMEEKQHRIRDAVITLLMSKRVSDLADQKTVRQELENAINKLLVKNKVSGLYFEEFIIQ